MAKTKYVCLYISEDDTLFAKFDPQLESAGSWDPPEQMKAFLEKHFNHNLCDSEREVILNDFPKPNCVAMEVPRLDEEVSKQLRCHDKTPNLR